MDTLV